MAAASMPSETRWRPWTGRRPRPYMSNKKNEIIQLSFKNNSMEEQLLLQWIKDNAVMMGKSTFIKSILFEKMKEEIQNN